MNWLGIINSRSIIDKINKLKFDAIVDLNQSHNQNLSFIMNDLNIPIKVGFRSIFKVSLLYNTRIKISWVFGGKLFNDRKYFGDRIILNFF